MVELVNARIEKIIIIAKLLNCYIAKLLFTNSLK